MGNFTEKGAGRLGEELGGPLDHTQSPRPYSLKYKDL